LSTPRRFITHSTSGTALYAATIDMAAPVANVKPIPVATSSPAATPTQVEPAARLVRS
jgi:hypothetical protein